MKINSTTVYIVNKNTVKQLIDELLKSGYTLKDDIRLVTENFGEMIDEGYYIPIFPRHPHVRYSSYHSKLSLAEIEMDVIKNDLSERVDEIVIYKPKVIL